MSVLVTNGIMLSFVIVASGSLALLLQKLSASRMRKKRISQAKMFVSPAVSPVKKAGYGRRVFEYLGALVEKSGIISPTLRSQMKEKNDEECVSGASSLDFFLGIKLCVGFFFVFCSAVFMLLSANISLNTLFLCLAFTLAGSFLPDVVRGRLYQRYLSALENGMPDALDLLGICAEAGMPIEGAIRRVAREMVNINGSVAKEFSLVVQDMAVMPDRMDVFRQMAIRRRIPVIRQFSTIILQSCEVGTPIVLALRALADELRQEKAVKYQKKMAQLPVMMTLPMILFILPVLFIVVIGPPLLQVLQK